MSLPENLGRVELEVLQLVAQHHPVTVREAAEKLAATSGQARTTVLTVLERLRKKGYLTRKKAAGVNRYSPRVPMAQLVQSLIGDFVERVLGGSVSPFVAYLGEQSDLTADERNQLKRLIKDLEAKDAPDRKRGGS